MRRAIRLEFRASIFIVIAPLLVIVGLGFSWPFMNSYAASWSSASSIMLQISDLTVPFVSGLAAWAGLRSLFKRVFHPVEGVTSLFAPTIYLPRLIVSVVYVMAAYAVITLVVIIRSAIIGLYPPLDIAPLVLALILPLVFVVIGTSLAVLIPNGLAILVAFALPILFHGPILSMLTFLPAPFSYMSIFNQYSWSSGFVANGAYFLTLMAEAVALTVVIAAAALMRQPGYRFGSGLVGAVAVICLVSFSALAIAQGGQTHKPIPNSQVPQVTFYNQAKTLSITIPKYYQNLGPELIPPWSRIANLFSKSSLAFDHLQTVDITLDQKPSPRFENLYLFAGTNKESTVQNTITAALDRVSGCNTTLSGAKVLGDFPAGPSLFNQWILGLKTPPPGGEDVQSAWKWLNSLNQSQAQDWVAERVKNITSCSWSRSDFGG